MEMLKEMEVDEDVEGRREEMLEGENIKNKEEREVMNVEMREK